MSLAGLSAGTSHPVGAVARELAFRKYNATKGTGVLPVPFVARERADLPVIVTIVEAVPVVVMKGEERPLDVQCHRAPIHAARRLRRGVDHRPRRILEPAQHVDVHGEVHRCRVNHERGLELGSNSARGLEQALISEGIGGARASGSRS